MAFRLVDLVNDLVGDAFSKINETLEYLRDNRASTVHGHGPATITAAGFMSASDKSKLDGMRRQIIKNDELVHIPPEEQYLLYGSLRIDGAGKLDLEGTLVIL